MLRVDEKRLSEDEALGVVAAVIDCIDAEGLASASLCGSDGTSSLPRAAGDARVDAALSSLGSSRDRATAVMVAEALAEKCFEAFQPALRQFQKNMAGLGLREVAGASREAPASLTRQLQFLQTLHTTFCAVRGVLQRWARWLLVPGSVDMFTLQVRCAMMQPDMLTGEMPRGRRELFSFLSHYGRKRLRMEGDGQDCDAVEDEEGDTPDMALATPRHPESYAAALRDDAVLRCLDELGMGGTAEVMSLWHDVLVTCITDKVATLDEDFTEHVIQRYLAWEEHVVEPFVAATLSRHDSSTHSADLAVLGDRVPKVDLGSPSRAGRDREAGVPATLDRDGDKDRWCAELRERLLVAFARRRVASFWDIMVEYPDSVPALEDLRYCLQSCPRTGIKNELTDHLRKLLATRLHRAGTRTEDILVMLSKAVNSLWVLVPRNEQSAVVFSVVSDTLEHLRRRKDCVPAVVQVLTQSGGDTAWHRTFDGGAGPFAEQESQEGGEAADDSGIYGGGTGGGERERPDILRILLTAIPVRALTEEYQHALAQRLLAKDLHDFDTTPEEEVLERLKCVLGGDAMPNCEVMIHDIQTSKRTTNQLRERLGKGGRCEPQTISLHVLSLTVWPKLTHCLTAGEPLLPPETYKCHPTLLTEMERLAEEYKTLKQGQKLTWMLSQGRITLDVKQRRREDSDELVTTSFTLSLFAASVLLHMMELDAQGDGVPVAELAAKLDVGVATLRPHLPQMMPSLLLSARNAGHEEGERVWVQRVLPTSTHVQFDEASHESAEQQANSSLEEEQLGLLKTMAVAMLQNGGSSSVADIMNSLKMFTGISLTSADMKHLMHALVAEGSVVQLDGKTFAIP